MVRKEVQLKKQLLQIIDNIKCDYIKDNVFLIKGDSLKILNKLPKSFVDMIFADPPYFLSGNGITCQSGKMVSVKKGDWDEKLTSKEKHEFNRLWIKECKKVLKEDGTIWISGTLHNIYSIGHALEEEGFKILNNITWQKTNPPPNLSCRTFTHSTETILWARKNVKTSKHKFNYKLMKQLNNNKQMKDVWITSTVKRSEKKYGNHPTQKPKEILEKIILASTDEGDIILDPFNGSGTTGVVANILNRKYIGIEKEREYIELSKRRLENEKEV